MGDQDLEYRVARLEALLGLVSDQADRIREALEVVRDGSLALRSERHFAIFGSKLNSYLASNAYFDGTNWQRYDTAAAAAALLPTGGSQQLTFLTAAAGANPIAWTSTSLTAGQVARAAVYPACRVFHNANQAIGSGANTTLAFNSERFDTDAFHDTATNNSRLTVPTGLGGLYLVTLNTAFAQSAAGTRRVNQIVLNAGLTPVASSEIGATSSATSFPIQFCAALYRLAAGDFVQAQVFQDSGGALNAIVSANIVCEFALVRLGD